MHRAVAPLCLAVVLFLAIGLRPSPAVAQSPCRFILGFADLAARLGPDIVGTCIEDQRTATGPDTLLFGSGLRLAIRTGVTFQRTTTGMFHWSPDSNVTLFTDGIDRYMPGPTGISKESWADLTADAAPSRPAPTPTPTPAPPPEPSGGEGCFSDWSTVRIRAVGTSGPERQRLLAEADAMKYLCFDAVERYGDRGYTCFSDAWAAAVGMERVFAGSGRQVYDDKFKACVAGR